VQHLQSALSFILSYAELAEKREHPGANKMRRTSCPKQGDDWTGTCQTGEKQSPIDLIFEDVSF